MQICPICNGIELIHLACPHCGALMEEHGKVSDYYAPYSPYREITHVQTLEGSDPIHLLYCDHYYHCPHCQHFLTYSAKQLEALIAPSI